MIKKTSKGYVVYNERGDKRLSKPLPTRQAARRRLAQVEYFKRKKK